MRTSFLRCSPSVSRPGALAGALRQQIRSLRADTTPLCPSASVHSPVSAADATTLGVNLPVESCSAVLLPRQPATVLMGLLSVHACDLLTSRQPLKQSDYIRLTGMPDV